jgi:hypothetical protein
MLNRLQMRFNPFIKIEVILRKQTSDWNLKLELNKIAKRLHVELSEDHKKELSSIYDSIGQTTSLVTIDSLLRRTLEIAKLYDNENGRNLMANSLNRLRNKQFNAANNERHKDQRETLTEELKKKFRSILLPYLAK